MKNKSLYDIYFRKRSANDDILEEYVVYHNLTFNDLNKYEIFCRNKVWEFIKDHKIKLHWITPNYMTVISTKCQIEFEEPYEIIQGQYVKFFDIYLESPERWEEC